jgi:hypothetical protein
MRNIFGSVRANVASRFLEDIPPHLVRNFQFPISTLQTTSRNKKSSKEKFNFEKSKERFDLEELRALASKGKVEPWKGKDKKIPSFEDGQRVRHKTFGEGVVLSSEKDIITIAFRKYGVKKISAKFAELEKI